MHTEKEEEDVEELKEEKFLKLVLGQSLYDV